MLKHSNVLAVFLLYESVTLLFFIEIYLSFKKEYSNNV